MAPVTHFAQRIAVRLGAIDGIVAVVLGGSVAQAVAAPSEASVACLEMLVQQVRRLCADVPGLRPAVAFRSVR
jgi:hypothetical protein